jgi:endogenous inhibitor of DNA gyrase (YacG/DUF329 family)
MSGRSPKDTGERSWKRIEAICGTCKSPFIGKTYKGRGGKFCSKPCAFVAMKKEKPPRVPVTKKCLFCTAEFSVVTLKNRRKFCSKRCGARYHERYGRLNDYPCATCGKTVQRKWSHKQARVFCSSSCKSIGKMLPFPRSNNFPAVRKWFSRYGRMSKCENCDYDLYPGILILHHKDRDRTNNCRDNLAVLCPNCHAIEHLDENRNGWQHHSKDPRKIELRKRAAERKVAA